MATTLPDSPSGCRCDDEVAVAIDWSRSGPCSQLTSSTIHIARILTTTALRLAGPPTPFLGPRSTLSPIWPQAPHRGSLSLDQLDHVLAAVDLLDDEHSD